MKNSRSASPEFLSGGGEMGERIRNFDWTKTPLGSFEKWPQSLRTIVSTCLHSKFPILIWWGDDLVKIYNDAYALILGTKHPNALGAKGKAVWPEIWDIIGPMLESVIHEGKATWSQNQLLLLNRNGYAEECYFTFSYSPIHGETNKIGGIFCAVTETSETVIGERQLTTLADLAKELSDATEDAEVFQTSLEVIQQNPRDFPFAAIYQVSSDGKNYSLAGKTQGLSGQFPDQPDGENNSALFHAITEAVQAKKASLLENLHYFPGELPKGAWQQGPEKILVVPINYGSSDFPVAVIALGLNPHRRFDDKYRNFIQLLSDQLATGIANARFMEEERKKKEALEELDRSKTLFFSNVSHEFRTPITLMLGPLEELINKPKTNLSAAEKQSMEIAHRNAMRLLKLVNTLLEFSRIESGRLQATYVLTDIAGYTSSLASNFRSVIEKAGLQFHVNADTIIKPVYIDRHMWEKIVFNLLSNAFKYTLSGKITLTVLAAGNQVQLIIEDTGTGIPEEELPRMFERFHRVEHVNGRSYEGSGIGLSLIKELVNLHGGTIAVESKEGQGSRFSVSIPFGKDHLPQGQIASGEQDFTDVLSNAYIEEASSLLAKPPARNKRPDQHEGDPTKTEHGLVLIVDDNADMRNHIESLIGAEFDTMTAGNGMEALHRIKERRPSLVLSDIMMPVMDGIQLLKEVKGNASISCIPVILITARAGEESKIEGYGTGADDYLVKPFSSKELIARVRAQLDIAGKRKEAEEKLIDFLRQTPAAIAILEGPQHVFTFANALFQKLFGRTAEQLTGNTLREIWPEVAGQHIYELFDQVFQTGESYVAHEFPVTFNEDGRPRSGYYEFVAHPIKNQKGIVTDIMVHAVETTWQVEAKKKVEEREKELVSMINAIPQVAWISNANGEVILYNEKVSLLSGMEKPTGGYVDWQDVLHPDDRELTLEQWKKAMANGTISEEEHRVKMKDGSYRWHLSRSVPVKDESGKVQNWYGTSTDIHDIKTSQQKIQESEERLRIATATTNAGTFDYNIRTGLLHWSDEMKQIAGFAKNENIDGTKSVSVIHPGDLEDFKKAFKASQDAGSTGELEYEFRIIRHNDKEERWVYARSKVFFEKDGGQLLPARITGILIDITDRKKIEQALRESEGRFRAMANEAPLFVWVTNETLQTTYLNKTGLNYFNLGESMDVSQLSWRKFIHPDDIDRVWEIMRDASQRHESYTLEMRLRNGVTGAYRWFLDKGVPRYDQNQLSGFVGTSLDIHDRKEAEKELEAKVRERTSQLDEQNVQLRKQNTLIKKILDSSADPIVVYDTATRVIAINPSSLNIFGGRETDVLGKKLLEILPQLENTKSHKDLLRAIDGETIQNEIYHSPITERYIENSLIPLRDDQERVYAVLVMAHDNTDLITTANRLKVNIGELQSTKSFLEQLMDSSVEFITVLDRDLRIITINKKVEDILGITRESVSGKPFFDMNPGVRDTVQHESILRSLDGDMVYLSKRPSIARPEIFLDTYFIPLVIQDQVEGTIIMARDVTDIVRSEVELQEKNLELQNSIDRLHKQELKDEKKNNFIAMASHELKTPVTSIKGYVQLLLNAYGKDKNEVKTLSPLLVRSSLISVDKQITRLTRLISELLDLSKIETGNLELKKEKFSLNQLAIETVEDILYTNTRHTISLYHDFHGYVYADKDRIGQVMINFLTNAIKYSSNSGQIDVWVHMAGNGQAAFSVKDYGIGIDKEDQVKIFERFYRARGREEQTYPGFGIGLFIASEFVQKHDGHMMVESEKGKGSVFTFTLPYIKIDSERKSPDIGIRR